MISLTQMLVGLASAYFLYTVHVFYSLFHPPQCSAASPHCLHPKLPEGKTLELAIHYEVFTSGGTIRAGSEPPAQLFDSVDFDTAAEATVAVPVPAVVSDHREELRCRLSVKSRATGKLLAVLHFPLTRKREPEDELYHLVGAASDHNLTRSEPPPPPKKRKANKKKMDGDKLVNFFHREVTLCAMTQRISFDAGHLPADVAPLLQASPRGSGKYAPIFFVDELTLRDATSDPVNASTPARNLTVTYRPVTLGEMRLRLTFRQSMRQLEELGFGRKDTEEIVGIIVGTGFYYLMLTFFVSIVHLLLDFLAFKNDISFWRGRDDIVGLSFRGVAWRCVSQLIITLYLLQEERVSMLVTGPAVLGTAIEAWKLRKAWRLRGREASTAAGQRTEAWDAAAMAYLSYVLYPLCAAGAVYSLWFMPHRSWYAWCVSSLVNGVYAFGFLFMLPQLFLNYKLKSVAHLPWKVFMYKAFNTFIDDIFAFIITMPTAHRLACFRDDVVFLIYLYQWWLYPVDKSRPNEYGQVFHKETSADKKAGSAAGDTKDEKAKKED